MADYNVREERSNAGATALATSVLSSVFGLTSELTQQVMNQIQSAGQMPALRQSLKLLPVSAHSRLNQIVSDGDNSSAVDTDFSDEDLDSEPSADMGMGDETELDDPGMDDTTDSMDPMDDTDIGDSDLGDDSDLDDDIASDTTENDFNADARKDSFKESTRSFASFRENAMMGAKLDNAIASDADSSLDPAALKKVKGLEMKGQKDAAQNIRKQAARKAQAGGAQRPTQRRVLAKKKELARAIQADKLAVAKEEGGDEQF